MNKKKELLIAVLGIIGVLVLTIGVTYSLLRYMREGSTENTITTGKITFLYTETSFGRGIALIDAMPMTDSLGIAQKGAGKVFDFKITADTMKSVAIPYTVTVKKQELEDGEESLAESDVKIYIAEVNDNVEENGKVGKFNDNSKFSKYDIDGKERIIYEGRVLSDTQNYIQNLRLKMWVSEDAEFSPEIDEITGEYKIVDGEYVYPNNNKTFKVKVNVYANGNVLTAAEVEEESKATMLSLKVGTKTLTEKTSGSKLYETTLDSGTTETQIDVETENEYQKVKVEKTQSNYTTVIGMNNDGKIERISDTKKLTLPLTEGENYFKITVTSRNKKASKIYKLHITVERANLLYKMKQGDYVAYVGNNGCKNNGTDTNTESKNSCLGWNANQAASDTTRFGYCGTGAWPSDSEKFKVYGWRIAYIENKRAYLVSAGAPECFYLQYSEGNADTIKYANKQAKKYCNSKFVDGNCSNNSDIWAINNTDFNKITAQITKTTGGYLYYPVISGATKCGDVKSNKTCGYGNTLIDNGSNYWFAASYSTGGWAGIVFLSGSSNRYATTSSTTSYAYGLRPIIRLSTTVYVSGGKGTMAEPYTIAND